MIVLLAKSQWVFASDEPLPLKADMSFIEFLGEGAEIDKEYIDPLKVKDYEEITNTVPAEDKQQND